jgi:methylmalonyl-CoA mutase
MGNKEDLFDQFPPVTTKEWMDKIHEDLKGADFNKTLVWKTNEGFEVMPFYREEDTENLRYTDTFPGEFPYLRGTKIKNNNWLVRQNIEVTDYSEANRKALMILMKGIDSLGFIITNPETVSETNFQILLKDIHIDVVELNFLCNGKAKETLEILEKISSERGLESEKIHGAIETDPLGRLMVNGTLCISVESGFDYLSSLTKSAAALPNIRTIHLNASHFNNSGGNIVQELAFGISMGSEYLSQLTDRGSSTDEAASKIRFSFGIGSGYFTEIAKLRAARLLWSVVVNGFKSSNVECSGMSIHCVTSEWNKTVYDPYVNMLRTQTEAMSAILGSTDSLTVEPFDIVFINPDEFSERIARNQQLILKEEAYFDKVADPAAGSYYIENLTSLIADNAWKLFLSVEEKGGFLSCLKSGFIQKELSKSALKRKSDMAHRKTILLGTNQYPDLEESVSQTVDSARVFRSKAIGENFLVDPITLFRGSEDYDKLRMAVDKAEKRPVVFLLPIGNPVMRKARSQFSAGLFGCVGYYTIENNGFENVNEGIKAAIESEADIVVLCSSDEDYMLYAPEIYKGLKDKAIIIIAGNPSCADELKAAGMEYFIHMRTNLPETIKYFNSRFGMRL